MPHIGGIPEATRRRAWGAAGALPYWPKRANAHS